jgi:hypothetical protein
VLECADIVRDSNQYRPEVLKLGGVETNQGGD